MRLSRAREELRLVDSSKMFHVEQFESPPVFVSWSMSRTHDECQPSFFATVDLNLPPSPLCVGTGYHGRAPNCSTWNIDSLERFPGSPSDIEPVSTRRPDSCACITPDPTAAPRSQRSPVMSAAGDKSGPLRVSRRDPPVTNCAWTPIAPPQTSIKHDSLSVAVIGVRNSPRLAPLAARMTARHRGCK